MSSKISLRQLVSVSGNLAVGAGEILREVHEERLLHGKEGLKIVDKGAAEGKGFDPQTIADRRAEKLILDGFRSVFGSELCIVGEESGLASGRKRDEEAEQEEEEEAANDTKSVHERIRLDWWLEADDMLVETRMVSVWIDPLDATREFTEGRVEFCSVLIGIAINGRSSAGVMFEPFSKSPDGPICWWGIKGKGCFRTPVSTSVSTSVSTRVDVTTQRSTNKTMRITTSATRTMGVVHQFTTRYIAMLENSNMNHSLSIAGGCGYKILLVLKGLVDLYPFPCPGTSMWDACAGDALLDAAGGRLTDKFGRRLVFDPNSSTYVNLVGLLASNDDRICSVASENISACLDYTRNLSNEFISNAYLQNILQTPRVLCYETPKSSLIVEKQRGIVEYDLIIICASEKPQHLQQKRKLKFRRFDPSNFLFQLERDDQGLARILAKRACEAYFLDAILGEMTNGLKFAGRVRSLERCPHRRPPTVNDVVSKFRQSKSSFTKLFLQSLAYVFIYEPDESESDKSIAADSSFLKTFHEFFWNNQNLAKKIAENGWRSHLDALKFGSGSEMTTANATLSSPAGRMRKHATVEHEGPRMKKHFNTGSGKIPMHARDEEEEQDEEHDDEEPKVVDLEERMERHSVVAGLVGANAANPKSRITVIRGVWKTSPRSLDDLTYCVAANEDVNNGALHLQDVVHLLMVYGGGLRNLQIVKEVYFGNGLDASKDEKLNQDLKWALFKYCKLIIPSPAFGEVFGSLAAQNRFLRTAEILCGELDEFREFNGTRLECFNFGENGETNVSMSRI